MTLYLRETTDDGKFLFNIFGDFKSISRIFEGRFDWVIGDDSLLANHDISYFQLIEYSLNFVREGGWLALYLPMNYMIHNPQRNIRRRFSPFQIWISNQSRATRPYALHLWQKGRAVEAIKLEWFE
jgi:hypothetical protein